ncbi:uncharacterized protein V6R79_017524 [Siganus canaliculatus]
MIPSAAVGAFLTSLLSVKVIQGREDWGVTYSPTSICAVKGSTVKISSSFRYPSFPKIKVERRLWFTKMNGDYYVELASDPQYSGRVSESFQGKSSTVTLRDVKKSDSAQFKFRFTTNKKDGCYTGKPGVTLTVTELQVQLVDKSSDQIKLMCRNSCLQPDSLSYLWFKNGKRINTQTSYEALFSPGESYSCALKGHEGFRSPLVYGPKPPSVSVSPSGEIVEGSSVTLTCSSDANPAANYTWYKENLEVLQGPTGIYQFISVSSEDTGFYYCQADNHYGRVHSSPLLIDVQYGPRPPSVSVSPSGEIVEGSSVTLTCSSDANPAANYIWYKENEESPKASGQNFTITDLRAEHSGNYYCDAQNKRGHKNSTSHKLTVVSESAKLAVGLITAAALAVIFLSAFVIRSWSRRNESSKQTREQQGREEQVSGKMDSDAELRPPEDEGGLYYTSVTFSKKQEDPLYSNIRSAQMDRSKTEEGEEDHVEYSVIKFKHAGASPQ